MSISLYLQALQQKVAEAKQILADPRKDVGVDLFESLRMLKDALTQQQSNVELANVQRSIAATNAAASITNAIVYVRNFISQKQANSVSASELMNFKLQAEERTVNALDNVQSVLENFGSMAPLPPSTPGTYEITLPGYQPIPEAGPRRQVYPTPTLRESPVSTAVSQIPKRPREEEIVEEIGRGSVARREHISSVMAPFMRHEERTQHVEINPYANKGLSREQIIELMTICEAARIATVGASAISISKTIENLVSEGDVFRQAIGACLYDGPPVFNKQTGERLPMLVFVGNMQTLFEKENSHITDFTSSLRAIFLDNYEISRMQVTAANMVPMVESIEQVNAIMFMHFVQANQDTEWQTWMQEMYGLFVTYIVILKQLTAIFFEAAIPPELAKNITLQKRKSAGGTRTR